LKELRITNYRLRIANYFVKLTLLFSSIVISSCTNKSQIQNPKFQIRDDAGIEVSFDSNPERIISLAPNITETIFAIGAENMLAGVTDLCDYPPEAKKKTKTGSYFNPDYEVMTSINPDLIIMNVESISNPTYQALKNMGMKIFVSNAKDIKGIEKMIMDFGKITGREIAADTIVRNLRTGMEQLVKKDTAYSKPVLILISVNPLMTTNGRTFINDILNLNHISNIYRDEYLDYPNISFEDIISKNPDFIIFPADTSDVQKNSKFIDEIKRQLKNTEAVKNDRIILIDENIMFRPGPRVLEAASVLRDKFSDAIK
jgi:iron complex transport system substrate-binding protein